MTLSASLADRDDPPRPGPKGDRTMKFTLVWRHPGEKKEWSETYEQITDDPEKWSRDIVAWFNSTLRPHERKREFIRCEVQGEVPPAEHKWFKVTAMTKSMVGGPRSGSHYDGMQSWGGECSLDQIHKQAADDAVGYLRQRCEKDGRLRIIGDPKVEAVITGRDR